MKPQLGVKEHSTGSGELGIPPQVDLERPRTNRVDFSRDSQADNRLVDASVVEMMQCAPGLLHIIRPQLTQIGCKLTACNVHDARNNTGHCKTEEMKKYDHSKLDVSL
jgi:hypothetical protein